MKNLIAALLFLLATTLSAQVTLNTNIRVAQTHKEKDVIFMKYTIELIGNQLRFDCTSGEFDFILTVEDKLSEEKIGEYIMLTYSTSEDDEVLFIFKNEVLISIVIKQINNVDLLYMHSEIEHSASVSYKL